MAQKQGGMMLTCDNCGMPLTGGRDTYGSYRSNLCSGCYLPRVPEIGYIESIRSNELIQAAETGDFSIVEKLIQHEANLDAQTEDGDTALILAANEGHIRVVALLLTHGANPNLQNSNGSTALDEAINKDKDDLVELLLANGANPNMVGRVSDKDCLPYLTPLGRAATKRNAHLVDLLLKYNADPNAKMSTGITALYMAAASGCAAIVSTLLSCGEDADAKADNNLKPVDIALRNKHDDVVQLLTTYAYQRSLFDEQTNKPRKEQNAKVSQRDKQIKVNGEKITIGKITPKKTTAEDIKKEAEPQSVQRPVLQPLLSELNQLIGLRLIKSDVSQLVNYLRVQQMRKEKGLSIPDQSLHMVFTGNPGTGKTTIARLIAQIYASLGILSEGQFVETDRSGLVGGFLGQTALKTKAVVESAIGGALFIDEAYSLTDDAHGRDMYGQEAVSTLLKLMEDHRDDLIVIVAGYTEPMQKFIRSNPGLQSRFNKFLHFDDYAPSELTEIFQHFATQGDYKLHPATELKLTNVFATLYGKRDETFGNARLARNLFEKAINNHANRMVSVAAMDEESLVTLYPEDIPNG